jgi:hypothetical protein
MMLETDRRSRGVKSPSIRPSKPRRTPRTSTPDDVAVLTTALIAAFTPAQSLVRMAILFTGSLYPGMGAPDNAS